MERVGEAELLEKMQKALQLPWSREDITRIADHLREGRLQAFWNAEAIVLTEICASPVRSFLNVYLVAGKLKALERLKPYVVAHAREHGLTEIQGLVRPEWAAYLKRKGWVKWAELWHLPVDKWDE